MNSKNKIISKDEKITKFSIISKVYGDHVVIIDTEDIEKIKDYKWSLKVIKGRFTCIRSSYKYKQSPIKLHRFLVNCDGSFHVDHINGDIFDNRKSNLRECTQVQNNKNMKMHRDNNAGYKGVDETREKYRARITVNGKTITIGTFETKEEAALAYNRNAKFYFGEFAKLNKLKEYEK